MRAKQQAAASTGLDEAAPLEAELRRRIEREGALPVAEYMALCLTHPEHGYYVKRAAIGASGDFVTAPEISQMFGELIGLWAGAVWQAMGSPQRVSIVELGPGRGTMMVDALRAAKVMPGFRAAIAVRMVEISEALERLQRRSLAAAEASWHRSLEEVPGGPAIVLANEFFDALPVHQAVMCADGWHHRVIDLDGRGRLQFGIDRDPISAFQESCPRPMPQAQVGDIFEWRSDEPALELGRRVVAQGGVVLIVDYGHTRTAIGDTLQAVSRHQYADPLLASGLVDLTAHVDFQALGAAAAGAGARIHGPISQARFLRRLGIVQRAAVLRAGASPDQAGTLDSALDRLTNEDRTGMGGLIKVIAFSDPDLHSLAGF
jgi:SAM-dependent MidA family methyltransferase